MGVIIPAILVSTRAEIEEQLAKLRGLVDLVQVDVVDGRMEGDATWPYAGKGLAELTPGFDIHEMGSFRFEMDLMVKEPHDAMVAFLGAGAGKLIFHAESTADLGALLTELETNYGRDKEFSPDLLSVAIALHADTDLSRIEPHLSRIDYVQFMGIAKEGRQGQPFDERVIERIREFRKTHPELLIQVDGAVSKETAPRLLDAGADRLVVGSALWKAPDIAQALHELESIAEEYGRYR